MFNHILLEVYCTKDEESNIAEASVNCCSENCLPGYRCLANNCPYICFTTHENAICYINETSEASDIIALGGDMIPQNINEELATQLWKQISRSKIQQAYEEYMSQIKEHIAPK